MRSSRYLLTRTWKVPAHMDPAEAVEEAKAEFIAEVEDLEVHWFKCLTAPVVEVVGDTVTCSATLRGPAGHGFDERKEVAA